MENHLALGDRKQLTHHPQLENAPAVRRVARLRRSTALPAASKSGLLAAFIFLSKAALLHIL
jgi:hypothetical protein